MRHSLYQLRAFQLALGVAKLLPRALSQRLAARIALHVYTRDSGVQATLRENLRRVSGLAGAALEALCARNVVHFGQMLADYFFCAGSAPDRATVLLHEWCGIEHFDAARAQGRGVVLVTAHLGNWELGGTLLALRGLPVTVVTLEEPSTELTRWRDRYRQRLGLKTITVGPGHAFALVEIIQTLRRNEIVAMLVDRPFAGSGLSVDFCGAQTEFSSAAALLWQHTGAAVVPAFVLQESGGRYVSFANPALPFTRDADTRAALVTNTQLLASHFEAIIREHPEQWFNYVPIWDRAAQPSRRQPARGGALAG